MTIRLLAPAMLVPLLLGAPAWAAANSKAELAANTPVLVIELSDGAAITDGKFSEDIAMRTELGLRTELEYIKDLHDQLAQPDGGSDHVTDDLLAIPLTADEVRRQNLSRDISQRDGALVQDYMTDRPGLSAGYSIEHEQVDYLRVRVTSGAEQVLTDLQSIVPHPDRLQVVEYPFSYDLIDELATSVVSQSRELALLGVEVVGGGFDSETGLARIDVSSDPGLAAKVIGDMFPEQSSMLSVAGSPAFAEGGSYDYEGPPMRGATRVYGDRGCTV